MRLIRETSSITRLLVFPLMALAGFGFFWLRWRPGMVQHLSHCPLKDGTGIPCPTCGGTHAAAALAAGHIPAALVANPLVVLVGTAFLLWAVWALAATIIPSFRYTLELTSLEKRAARILAALVLLLTWAWQLRILLP